MVKPKPPRPHLLADVEELNPAGPAGKQAATLQQMNRTLQAHSAQFDKLLQAVLDTKTGLEGKIDSVVIEVNLLRADHRKLAERVSDNKRSIAVAQPGVKDLHDQVQRMETEVAESQERALREANLFKSPLHQTYRDPDGAGLGLSADPSSGSSSPLALGPELTPCTADDL
ncbi:hypothetical protein NDU88_006580 [Pleurodeles waltl]|uniref:Uncharacterized protein n=1 Tax=Pleurodeles waltl TaxID=8319 RepID=A0AAV7N3W5_PLEWA|nr:hypothetical protein NDU88_006580 [Pleurodeles waltl]